MAVFMYVFMAAFQSTYFLSAYILQNVLLHCFLIVFSIAVFRGIYFSNGGNNYCFWSVLKYFPKIFALTMAMFSEIHCSIMKVCIRVLEILL